MTQEFENMLYLFGCGATGALPAKENCINLSEIRKLAISQNIWPIVYSAVRKKIEDGEVQLPEDVYNKLEISFQANLGKAFQKNEFNKKTIRKLEENGIECCLFKGMALADLYDVPETRVSADADILIPEEKESLAMSVLTDLGYRIFPRQNYDHHASAIHPIGGELEVHIRVMRKNWDDIIFENKIEYNEEYAQFDGDIKTLGVNDALLNTATHFIKHFVRSGAGVRHIMDMLLYMKKYNSQIDWDRFNKLMSELHYDKLIDTAKAVGVKYWGFSFDDVGVIDNVTLENFITDIELGGVFGGDDAVRKETYAQFTKKRKNLSESEYKKYSLSNMDKTFLQKIFPSKDYMKKGYGMKKDNIFYLLSAHLRRMFTIIKNIVTGKREFSQYVYDESKEITPQVKERVELFEKLGIIKQNGENK